MLDCVIYQVAVAFKQVVFSQKMTRTDDKYMVHWGFVFVHCPVCFFFSFFPQRVLEAHRCSRSNTPAAHQHRSDFRIGHRLTGVTSLPTVMVKAVLCVTIEFWTETTRAFLSGAQQIAVG